MKHAMNKTVILGKKLPGHSDIIVGTRRSRKGKKSIEKLDSAHKVYQKRSERKFSILMPQMNNE